MGTKVTAQETGRTSFGSTGLLSMQKIELIGRKLDCKPLSNYEHYLPPLIILAAFAQGQSVFRGLDDLRNDEPDGIDLLESCIRRLGARHGEMPDGIVMEGGKDFDGFDFETAFSAELSAAFAIAGLHCVGTTTINDEFILKRWPDFETILTTLFEPRS
jgi:5-enolpyruvylshikimate-3-phosphate synthase